MSSGWPSSKSDVWGVYYGHCEIVIIFTLWPVECKEVGTYNNYYTGPNYTSVNVLLKCKSQTGHQSAIKGRDKRYRHRYEMILNRHNFSTATGAPTLVHAYSTLPTYHAPLAQTVDLHVTRYMTCTCTCTWCAAARAESSSRISNSRSRARARRRRAWPAGRLYIRSWRPAHT